tara:strand:- start:6017 stop:6328 length:312 start_codon:yes stop_codon:yes gene_type:complete
MQRIFEAFFLDYTLLLRHECSSPPSQIADGDTCPELSNRTSREIGNRQATGFRQTNLSQTKIDTQRSNLTTHQPFSSSRKPMQLNDKMNAPASSMEFTERSYA